MWIMFEIVQNKFLLLCSHSNKPIPFKMVCLLCTTCFINPPDAKWAKMHRVRTNTDVFTAVVSSQENQAATNGND